MSGFVKCYDTLEMVIEDATKQLGVVFCENAKAKSDLKVICDNIDSMIEQYGGVSYEVSMDRATMDVTISLVCEGFETEREISSFHRVCACAKKLVFKQADEDHVQIDFIFGIFKRVV